MVERMNVIIPLLGTAAAAAAYFGYNKMTRERILDYQYKQIRDAAAVLSSKNPITVLVLGFRKHGRSSFINTIFRVLYKEEGPLIMRAETGPAKVTTSVQRVHKVRNKLLVFPKILMNIIDTPCSSSSEEIDDNAIRNVLRGGVAGMENNESEIDGSKRRNVYPVSECVILVIKAQDCYMGGPALEKLPELVRIIREEGLRFVVILTHKKVSQAEPIDLKDLTRSVALKSGTDFVHCIENYVADHSGGKDGSNVSNDFDTHCQTLSTVRQCFEYVRQHRLMKLNNLQTAYDSSDSD